MDQTALITGLLTTIISCLGMFFSFKHFLFYSRMYNNDLARRIRNIFITDSMIYSITFYFGLWAIYNWGFGSAVTAQIIRIPILVLNVIASYRLYVLYKQLHG